MGQPKRQRMRKKYRYGIDRKRLRKAQESTGTPAVEVPIVKKAWDHKKSIQTNLKNMGLSHDANVTIKIPTTKDFLRPVMYLPDDTEIQNKTESEPVILEKGHIVEEIEKFAKAPREKRFKLPNGQVLWLTYLLDKYGDDYKAMTRDNRNIYQETWKQIRNKILKFQNIPDQWNAYLASKEESIKE